MASVGPGSVGYGRGLLESHKANLKTRIEHINAELQNSRDHQARLEKDSAEAHQRLADIEMALSKLESNQ